MERSWQDVLETFLASSPGSPSRISINPASQGNLQRALFKKTRNGVDFLELGRLTAKCSGAKLDRVHWADLDALGHDVYMQIEQAEILETANRIQAFSQALFKLATNVTVTAASGPLARTIGHLAGAGLEAESALYRTATTARRLTASEVEAGFIDVSNPLQPHLQLKTRMPYDLPLQAPTRGATTPSAIARGSKYEVGEYAALREAAESGLDAHHVGQKALMGRFIPGYDLETGPSILVPKVGHTIRGPQGIVSRSTSGFTDAREVIARDIWELRRVYPDIPNSQLKMLIDMNKQRYPIVGARGNP